ncbi:TnsA-like heteromeric transposase endonuclease subunit [Microbacterium terricola]|uniref:TnsA endonuclease N-terminal domain-containing protein n=1 Tax=Microbacterium terricola TaxID=344163 RepID=A0ABM8E3G1_9MICO|nr:TnsA-like heteromeric transposase endonuclease subunit [Microbacterium terricola]UYK40054.1 TnsA-like heteromeric transposase endonuclease subunit [Microbacterium terricola]BDV32251.1 hypothetical protein Microterr_29110 [Microbacterium terricola]
MNRNTPESLIDGAEWLTLDERRVEPLSPDLLSEELYLVDRIREGHQYKGQKNYHNWYWCASTGRHVWCESMLERAAMMQLDFAAGVVAVASQPMKLTMRGEVHFPDFLVLHNDGTQSLVDVKPEARVEHARRQFELTAQACARVGWGYRVLTELPPQHQVTLEFISHFRHPVYAPPADAYTELDTAFEDGWTFHDLVAAMPAPAEADARAMALHVLWSRKCTFDLGDRLSPQTVLHAAVVAGLEAVDALR